VITAFEQLRNLVLLQVGYVQSAPEFVLMTRHREKICPRALHAEAACPAYDERNALKALPPVCCWPALEAIPHPKRRDRYCPTGNWMPSCVWVAACAHSPVVK
jgi:hypothetical protein